MFYTQFLIFTSSKLTTVILHVWIVFNTWMEILEILSFIP